MPGNDFQSPAFAEQPAEVQPGHNVRHHRQPGLRQCFKAAVQQLRAVFKMIDLVVRFSAADDVNEGLIRPGAFQVACGGRIQHAAVDGHKKPGLPLYFGNGADEILPRNPPPAVAAAGKQYSLHALRLKRPAFFQQTAGFAHIGHALQERAAAVGAVLRAVAASDGKRGVLPLHAVTHKHAWQVEQYFFAVPRPRKLTGLLQLHVVPVIKRPHSIP